MITIKEIANAINTAIYLGLKGTVYEQVKFSSTDIKEGFVRPSLFLELGNSKKSARNQIRADRELMVRIYYFPKDEKKPRLENMDVQDLIENILLNPIIANPNFSIIVEETESDTSDGVLQVSFAINTVEEIEIIDTYEFIETLELNRKEGENNG